MIKDKIITAEQAVSIIEDGRTVALNGFLGAGVAEELYIAIRDAFLKTGHPRDLSLVYASSQGDGSGHGADIFAVPGLIRRVVCGHWGLTTKLQEMVRANEIEAYNLPQGVLAQLYRDIAAHRPGLITRVGLNTCNDPDHGGGRLNERTTEDLVKKITLQGEEYLFFPASPVDIAILHGSYADSLGNITFRDERYKLEALDMVIACHNSGGKVIVHVKDVLENERFPADQVAIPHILVDYIVKMKDPASCSDTYGKQALDKKPKPGAEAIRGIIARRAAMEVNDGELINLGIGLPEKIAEVLADKIEQNKIVCTIESGMIGGKPLSGINFGMSGSPLIVVDSATLFNLYDGGGLDKAFLGMAECDLKGNINVASFAGRIAGVGGFLNIAQNTKYLNFCGLFSVGAELSVEDGKLVIHKEGKCKIAKKVEQIAFDAENAEKRGQKCQYITERCVFALKNGRLELTEIAPGIDLQKDILDLLGENVPISENLKLMDASVFAQ